MDSSHVSLLTGYCCRSGKTFSLYVLHLCQEGGVIITGHYYGHYCQVRLLARIAFPVRVRQKQRRRHQFLLLFTIPRQVKNFDETVCMSIYFCVPKQKTTSSSSSLIILTINHLLWYMLRAHPRYHFHYQIWLLLRDMYH